MPPNIIVTNRIPKNLNKTQRRMAEEVLDKNMGDHCVTILSSTDGDKLPPVSEMVPIYHKGCNGVAFYYTHQPKKNELMTATRAKFPDGSRPERGQAFVCGSCKERVWYMGELTTTKRPKVALA